MKTVIVISRRGLILIGLIALLLGGNAYCKDFYNDTQISSNRHGPKQDSLEWQYKDALKTILLPYVQEAVTDYYEKNKGYSPIVDLWGNTDLISFESLKTYIFIIKFEVSPYLGAHNSIGVDEVTLRVSFGDVKVEKYEHIKDFPIPPWLQPLE